MRGEVQDANCPERLPHLAGWCAGLLQPAVDRFRNRTRREEMASALRQLAVHGNLSALVGMIDNPDRRLADEEGFRRARAEFDALAEQMRSEEHTSELQSLMRNTDAVFRFEKNNT